MALASCHSIWFHEIPLNAFTFGISIIISFLAEVIFVGVMTLEDRRIGGSTGDHLSWGSTLIGVGKTEIEGIGFPRECSITTVENQWISTIMLQYVKSISRIVSD
jgi:hypothetical protein